MFASVMMSVSREQDNFNQTNVKQHLKKKRNTTSVFFPPLKKKKKQGRERRIGPVHLGDGQDIWASKFHKGLGSTSTS